MTTWLRHLAAIGLLCLLTLLFAIGRSELHPLHLYNRPIADASFVMLCVTMMIGPVVKFVSFLRPLLPWRRETGIAFAGGSLLHVVALTGGYNWNLMHFFARDIEGRSRLLENMYAAANWVGLVALVYALVLTITSNDWSQKALGGGWKFLQQQSYTLFILVVLHTALFAFLVLREDPGIFVPFFVVLGLLTIILQLAGYFKTVYGQNLRRRRRT